MKMATFPVALGELNRVIADLAGFRRWNMVIYAESAQTVP
jgi:hypothetical protein